MKRKTVNPYAVMCTLCTIRSEDFAKAHTWEVTEMLNEGCPSVEEAVKIIDKADNWNEIKERMQAIYDHLDAINDILNAAETVKDIRCDLTVLQVERKGKTPFFVFDTGDFIDPADII